MTKISFINGNLSAIDAMRRIRQTVGRATNMACKRISDDIGKRKVLYLWNIGNTLFPFRHSCLYFNSLAQSFVSFGVTGLSFLDNYVTKSVKKEPPATYSEGSH